MGRKKRKPSKPWCWYCNREFDEEKILIQHQKAKHFKCFRCNKKLFTGPGLAIHCSQVHKEYITAVPNALESRKSIEVAIFGMEGIPEESIREHENEKKRGLVSFENDDEDSQPKPESSNANKSGMPSLPMPGMPGNLPMPGMMPGMPPMPGMMPGMPMGPPMPGMPMGAMPPELASSGMNKELFPYYASGFNFGQKLMSGVMDGVNFPATTMSTIHAPPKPLFPAAVSQSNLSSSTPVGADFKPLTTTAASAKPTFPAYSSSPSTSDATSNTQSNSEAKKTSTVTSTSSSSKIMHPEEDISLEEIKANLPQYKLLLMNADMMSYGGPIPPGTGVPSMAGMGAFFGGQPMHPQGSMPQMMGQGGSRPY